MLQLMREVIALAEKLAVDLSEKDIEEWLAVLATLAPEGNTSMFQDVEAKRKQYGIATPVNRAIMNIVKVME